MKFTLITSVLEFLGIVGTVTATYLALGMAAALYVASAWALLIAYAISRNP